MAYLRKVLLPWGPGRKWRLLLVDAFSAHLDDAVARLAWDRGYLVVHIGGGCTGAIQPLDTRARPSQQVFSRNGDERLAEDGRRGPRGFATS